MFTILLACLLLQSGQTDPLTLRGTLLDAAGQPVNRALVRALPIDARRQVHGQEAIAGMSDPDGRFELILQHLPEALRLDARAPGYAPSLIDRIEPNMAEIDVGSMLLLPGVAVSGHVTDMQGRPVAGARVFVNTAFHRGLAEADCEPATVTGDDGGYRIDGLPVGRLSLGFAAPGMVFQILRDLDVADPMLREVDLQLEPSALFQGRAEIEGGSVVSGLVELQDERKNRLLFREPIAIGPDGRFEIDGLPADRTDLWLGVSAPGLDPARFDLTRSPSGSRFLLQTAPTIRVEAVGDQDDLAIARIDFEVYSRSAEGWVRADGTVFEEAAVLEAPDVWTISVPRGDSARLTVHATDGREARTDDVPLGRPNPMVVAVFQQELSLSGRITGPEGSSTGGRRVELGHLSSANDSFRIQAVTSSDPEGRFLFEGLRPGGYAVREASLGGVSEIVRVSLRYREEPPEVDLQQRPPAGIAGRLTLNGDRPGLPVLIRAYRFVRLASSSNWREVAAVTTDRDGSFEIHPLHPGTVALVPSRPPESSDGSQQDRGAERPPVLHGRYPWLFRLDDGDIEQVKIDFEVPDRSWLSGRLCTNGVPRAGLALTLRAVEGGIPTSVRTGRSGRFRFRVEGGGPFHLDLTAGALSSSTRIVLEEGVDRTFNLDLSVGAVAGMVLFEEGGPRIRVRLETRLGDAEWTEKAMVALEEAGPFRFDEVLEGVCRIVAQDAGKRYAVAASQPFSIRPEETLTVPALELQPGITITAVMTCDTDGETLPFATLEIRAAAGEAALPTPFTAWFVGDSATVYGLPAGRVVVSVKPYGEWTCAEEQTVALGRERPLMRLKFRIRKQGR